NGWASAATQIQWAMDQAIADDTVLVSNGTYNLTNQIEITNNLTVKSLNGTNFTFVNGNYPDYSNRCVFMTLGTLDGFTISNGYLAAVNSNYPGYGAGVLIGGAGLGMRGLAAGSRTVKNCYIHHNVISNGHGGGLQIVYSTGVIVSNCTIVSNICGFGITTENLQGGGISVGGFYVGSTVVMIDSYIYGNIGNYGGGFYFSGGGLITNCIIAGNHANKSDGGGRIESLPAGVIGIGMANCVISNNTSAGDVGGVRLDYGGGGIIINSIIIANTAASGVGGAFVHDGGMLSNCQVIGNSTPGYRVGGVVLAGSAVSTNVVANCIIANNSCARNDSAAGIRVENGGLVKNCLIYGNTNNNYGGGVQLYNAALYTNSPYGLINCTIVDNVSGNRSGINAIGSSNYVENCIVVSNVTFGGAQDNIYNNTAANTNNYWYTCAPTNILPPNQGNITSDPLFVNRPDYNYRLANNSLCINAGTNSAWITDSVDLDGRMRIRYGTVDMGAYEFIRSGLIFGFH
ncbi:MAG: hypothetical protein KKF10_03880, partial [Verrucomicrobia bacterium]|nr:hypothetical protein [Verrucomicrobiota bacterium]